MNTKIYGSMIKKQISFVVIVAVIVLILVIIITALMPQKISVSLSIAVDVSDQQQTNDYKFSRYYGTEASEKFAETVASWFQSPEVVQRIFTEASLEPGTTSVNKLAKIFDAEPLAAQNVQVNFSTGSDEEAQKLLQSIRETVDQKTSILNRDEDTVFVAEITEPIVLEEEKGFLVNAIVGLIIGLILGMALVTLRKYWNTSTE